MTTPVMPRVILFKTPGSTSSPDTYDNAFHFAGYTVQYIPVLRETFELERLQELFRHDDKKGEWAGVVITSKRGAEAWIKAAESCSGIEDLHTDWSKIQLFSVGASSLGLFESERTKSPEWSRLDTAGAVHAKSATTLLPLLLAHSPDQHRPYLLIRGDKSTNELQDGLTAVGRSYHEIIAYKTSARLDLDHELRLLMRQTNIDRERDWMAFFSPSSAELGLSHPLFLRASAYRGKIAAIGETTAAYLRQAGWKVDAVADQPTAEGLLKAIQGADQAE